MELTRRLEGFLNDLEKFCVFIKNDENILLKAKEVTTRMQSQLPPTIIIYGSGAAISALEKIKMAVQKNTLGYEVEEYLLPHKKIIFFNKKETQVDF